MQKHVSIIIISLYEISQTIYFTKNGKELIVPCRAILQSWLFLGIIFRRRILLNHFFIINVNGIMLNV